jgi:hypothetical protein
VAFCREVVGDPIAAVAVDGGAAVVDDGHAAEALTSTDVVRVSQRLYTGDDDQPDASYDLQWGEEPGEVTLRVYDVLGGDALVFMKQAQLAQFIADLQRFLPERKTPLDDMLASLEATAPPVSKPSPGTMQWVVEALTEDES